MIRLRSLPEYCFFTDFIHPFTETVVHYVAPGDQTSLKLREGDPFPSVPQVLEFQSLCSHPRPFLKLPLFSCIAQGTENRCSEGPVDGRGGVARSFLTVTHLPGYQLDGIILKGL